MLFRSRCFIHTFPDKPVSRNYKTKEKSVVDYVLQNFPNFTWYSDKKISNGCSRRRPDLLADFGDFVMIIEIDENQHNDYDTTCENKRLMELSQSSHLSYEYNNISLFFLFLN